MLLEKKPTNPTILLLVDSAIKNIPLIEEYATLLHKDALVIENLSEEDKKEIITFYATYESRVKDIYLLLRATHQKITQNNTMPFTTQ